MKLTKSAFTLIVIAIVSGGCATFRAQPISPKQRAAAFEARTLDSSGLREFLRANLGHDVTPWPPKTWDFQKLTLAAFYYHPDLDVARAKWSVAKAGVITAGGGPNPSIGFIPDYNADAGRGVSPWKLPSTYDVPIETAGKRGYRIDQARQLSEAARLNIATTAWRVRSRLRARLLDFYAASQTQGLLERQQAVQEEIVKLLDERLKYGEASQPDVTLAHISLDQARISLRRAQKQTAEARTQLADALGLPAGALDGINLSFDLFARVPPMITAPSDVRRRALFNRPDILGALAEYAASQSALQLEIAKQYPDVHLGPGYAWDQGDDKWSLGISLTLPVFNQNQGPIAEADARRKERAARFAALQAQVIGEVERALAGSQAALQTLKTADGLVSSRKEQQRSVQAMFDIGQSDRLELSSAELELDSAMLSRLDALMKAQQSLALVEDAMKSPLNSSESFSTLPEANPRSKEENKP